MFVNLTMFKSGTHLIRKILKDLTGLDFYEPLIAAGKNNYEDESKFFPKKNAYFSWHLFPGEYFNNEINRNCFKTIYLVRNLFDQLLSARDHFLNNVDVEIGRGSYVGHKLARFSEEELAHFFVYGGKVDSLHWRGVLHQHKHMKMLFASAVSCNSLIVTYEDLIFRRAFEVHRIAKYLEIDSFNVQDVVRNTDISSMRDNNLNKSHFNVGKVGRIFHSENRIYLDMLTSSAKDFLSFDGYDFLTDLKALTELVERREHEVY